jgi:branched-chain amino acid transport system ATP-binding protein
MNNILEVKGVSKVWPEVRALTNVNFSLMDGEIHAIIGPNGAGKSTFFGAISGGIEITEGEVWFLNQNVTKVPDWMLTQMGMGRAFQVPKIFPNLSIEENLLISLRIKEQWKDQVGWKGFLKPSKKVRAELEEVLFEIGLHGEKNKKVSTISHGDKKRLEIAIAISLEPKLLLLDEPTAGMSPEDTHTTVELIKKIHASHRLTILLTEHDMEVVFRLAHRISVLNRGELVATGLPEEIRSNALVKEIYLGKGAEEHVGG